MSVVAGAPSNWTAGDWRNTNGKRKPLRALSRLCPLPRVTSITGPALCAVQLYVLVLLSAIVRMTHPKIP